MDTGMSPGVPTKEALSGGRIAMLQRQHDQLRVRIGSWGAMRLDIIIIIATPHWGLSPALSLALSPVLLLPLLLLFPPLFYYFISSPYGTLLTTAAIRPRATDCNFWTGAIYAQLPDPRWSCRQALAGVDKYHMPQIDESQKLDEAK